MYSSLRYILLFIAAIPTHIVKAQISDPLYDSAFNSIHSMLSEASLDFKKAVLYTENAYYEDNLDEDIFDYHIKLMHQYAEV